MAVPIEKQCWQNVTVELSTGIEDACRRRSPRQNCGHRRQMIPILLRPAMQRDMQPPCTVIYLLPFCAALECSVCDLRAWVSGEPACSEFQLEVDLIERIPAQNGAVNSTEKSPRCGNGVS